MGTAMVLAAAGKVDVDRLIEHAETHFGDMEPAPRPVAELAAYQGGTFVERRHLDDALRCNQCRDADRDA